jgi:hypothetical protein
VRAYGFKCVRSGAIVATFKLHQGIEGYISERWIPKGHITVGIGAFMNISGYSMGCIDVRILTPTDKVLIKTTIMLLLQKSDILLRNAGKKSQSIEI